MSKLPGFVEGKPNNGPIYLLGDNGQRQLLEAKEYYVSAARTNGILAIYDSRTGMVSDSSVYLHKNGRYYIKKNAMWQVGPTTFFLDEFGTEESK